MNAQIMRLKAKVKNLALEKRVPAQTALQCYALERFLVRLARTSYRDKFVLKGGLLISSWVGLAVRTTMDLDGSVRGVPITESSVLEFIREVVSIDVADGFSLEVGELRRLQIREGDAGIRVSMIARADPLAIPFTIDLTAGDVIVPKESSYDYPMMLDEGTVPILTYTVETVLSEKLDSILSRGIFNTRMRDYYDIHILIKMLPYNLDELRQAVASTFAHRASSPVIERVETILADLASSQDIRRLWNAYCRKYIYAKDLELDVILASIRELVASL